MLFVLNWTIVPIDLPIFLKEVCAISSRKFFPYEKENLTFYWTLIETECLNIGK